MLSAPDRWVILEISPKGAEKFYKVMGGWRGGYASSDSWRINSGITGVLEKSNTFDIGGHSGSRYVCNKDRHGLTGLMADILHKYLDETKEIRLLDKDEAWATLKTITTTA